MSQVPQVRAQLSQSCFQPSIKPNAEFIVASCRHFILKAWNIFIKKGEVTVIFREHIFLGLGLMAILALVGLMTIFVVVAGAGGALAIVAEASGGDDDQPITGEARAKCAAAALAEHPGGTVTETEVGDDGAAYGVEIRREDGSQVEVQLNENCQVIGQEVDDDGPNDQDGPNDD